ncbi:hypothetical protein [Chryseobacterium lactis]|uniref:hypothetical protein n=1 Tax=Chryseobacterium lactis TaxID=1241981 RepID=UPI001624AD50|nr:hypothetical protein [Chryseobacterium lactis]
MKELQKLTKEQLYEKLKEKSENFYSTVHAALENNFFDIPALDEESLSEFLEMLDEETAEKIKEASLSINNNDDAPEILLINNESHTALDLTTEDGEGYTIILIENDIHLSGDLFIEDYVVLIVAGNIKAENIIVNGSLYCSGSLSCNVLFGASSNDNETRIEGSIIASLVAENGHYTAAEGNLYSKYLISFHNEIEGKTGKFIENSGLERASEIELLNPVIIDKDGYFDEEAFLHSITIFPVETLFK